MKTIITIVLAFIVSASFGQTKSLSTNTWTFSVDYDKYESVCLVSIDKGTDQLIVGDIRFDIKLIKGSIVCPNPYHVSIDTVKHRLQFFDGKTHRTFLFKPEHFKLTNLKIQ